MSSSAQVPHLTVDSGRHRSAAVPVSLGETTGGSDVSNAVVVSDHAAPVGFKLMWDGRTLALSAVDAEVHIDGKVLRHGQDCPVKRSASFMSGGIAFRLDLPSKFRPASDRSRQRSGSFAAGVACSMALVVTGGLIAAPSRPPPTRLPATSTVSQDTTGPIPAKVEGAVAVERANLAGGSKALLGNLRRQLASAGLDAVVIDLQPDGAVAANGRIVPSKGEAWHAAVRWFDTVARGQAVLVDHVEISAAAAALQVQAVYTGSIPYVIDGEGEKLFVGSSLPDGSVIQKIESQRILVKRGDQMAAVRF